MENNKSFNTPSRTLARMQIVHFGKILFNLQFVALAIMVASIVSFIMPAIYYLILICLAFFTFFVVFASPSFRTLWLGGETLSKIAIVLNQSWKYTVPIVLVLAIASIFCLCFDKNQKHPARIVVSVIICIGALVVLFAKLINRGTI